MADDRDVAEVVEYPAEAPRLAEHLMIVTERSMFAHGELLATHRDELPADSFPLVRSVATAVADYEYV